MNLELKDKVAIVCASSSGLGKAIATELCYEGARVMLFSPAEDQLKEAQAEIGGLTENRPEYFVGDITKAEDIRDLVVSTTEKLGPVYALMNNTGGPAPGAFDQFSDEDWQYAYELCLLSYIRLVRECLPVMRANGGGRILNSTSSSVKAVLDNLILSNTFRMGVVGLSKTLSQELGKDNILVNVIGPGRIGTARIAQLDKVRAKKAGKTVEEIEQSAYAGIPLGRYGRPEEYGKLAAFLLAPSNTYITGQTVLVDGGLVKAI